MMNGIDHIEFQDKAVAFLLNKSTDSNSKKIIMLKAPTGAGKTILLVEYVDQYLIINSQTVFVWLCPGKGNLEEQSKDKMDQFCPSRETMLLQDVLSGGFEAASTVFINWELITKKGNKAITESEKKNLYERIDDARRSGIEFIVIVDEEHANYTDKAEAILDYLKPKHIIRVSATPSNGTNREFYEIPEDEVINSGLITKAIYINMDFKADEVIKDENLYLLDMADKKRKEIEAEYKKIGKNIRPLVLIQFPNDNQDIINSVLKHLESKGYTYENGMVAIWMSNDKKNLEGITESDATPLFLLMKQAIAMGWDCPRAKVLLKIRDNMGEVFTIQTIGRLRRMPERVHYENPVLDYCYVYTTDSEWKTGLMKNFSDAYEATRLFLKSKCKGFKLTREVKSREDEIDEKDVYKRMFEHFKNKYGTGKDLEKNKQLLETAGYDFSDSIKTQVRKDKITHTMGIAEDSGDHVTAEVAVDTHRDGAKLMTAANYIGSIIGMNEYRMGVILAKLFKLNKSDKYDIQDLPSKEYLAFIVNNQEKLQDEVNEIRSGIVEQKAIFGHTKEKEFTIPREDVFCFDSSDAHNFILDTNAYENYSSAIINTKARSKTERLLELYIDEHKDKVDWLYKNGDKGLQYFGIVYINGVGQMREFYPDYIIKKADGSIWVLEAKGGKKKDGTSNNIDANAHNKFDALKKYVVNHPEIHWGFVREVNDILRFNNTTYQEDPTGDQWVLFKDIF